VANQANRPSKERYLRTPLASYPFDLQARLLDAGSVQDIYEIGVAMLARIPATIGVRIFQRDDEGGLVLVHAWQSPLANAEHLQSEALGQAVYQRWIAAHRVGHNILEFARPFAHPTHPAWLIVPMLAGDELIGALAVERRDGDTFPYAPEDVVALSAAAAGMAWGIQSIFLRGRTDHLRIEDDLTREEIAAQERREVGRELHDNVVQNLAYLNMKMEIVERYTYENPDIARSELQAARDLLDRTITELRRTIGEMRRPTPARHGITGQLRSIAHTMAIEVSDVDLDLKQISGVQLVPEVERAVVGIVREALQNVRKHANANSVKLEVVRGEEELLLQISDDGIGMGDPHHTMRPDHFGMEQMRELAEDLGGTLEVVSMPGHGTAIEARLPLVIPAAVRDIGSTGLSASEYLSQPPTETASGYLFSAPDSSNPPTASSGGN
jgi:signal transduction histidine kinase